MYILSLFYSYVRMSFVQFKVCRLLNDPVPSLSLLIFLSNEMILVIYLLFMK